jgi:uncharacterized membrane protein
MSRYELLLFGHVVFVILWVGAGSVFHVLGLRAERADDNEAIEGIFKNIASLGTTFFLPSSLLVLVFGLLLVWDSDVWSFSQLWIDIGLAGFAVTFLTGLAWIKPQSEKIAAMIERDGGMTPVSLTLARRMVVFGRLDYVVLYLVVADMIAKPTGEDVGLLIAGAVIFVAAGVYFATRARALAPAPA